MGTLIPYNLPNYLCPSVTESIVEQAALEWFEELGYETLNATGRLPQVKAYAERDSYADVVLVIERLQNAL